MMSISFHLLSNKISQIFNLYEDLGIFTRILISTLKFQDLEIASAIIIKSCNLEMTLQVHLRLSFHIGWTFMNQTFLSRCILKVWGRFTLKFIAVTILINVLSIHSKLILLILLQKRIKHGLLKNMLFSTMLTRQWVNILLGLKRLNGSMMKTRHNQQTRRYWQPMTPQTHRIIMWITQFGWPSSLPMSMDLIQLST
jgi:hypothetical protein